MYGEIIVGSRFLAEVPRKLGNLQSNDDFTIHGQYPIINIYSVLNSRVFGFCLRGYIVVLNVLCTHSLLLLLFRLGWFSWKLGYRHGDNRNGNVYPLSSCYIN